MKFLNLFLSVIFASVTSLANAAPGVGNEPKKVIECDIYDVYQYKSATFFKGILHLEHRYQMVNTVSKEEMHVDFNSHSEGASLKVTEIYEHDPKTGAATKFRKLSIVSWNDLFYMDVNENSGAKSRFNCSVVR